MLALRCHVPSSSSATKITRICPLIATHASARAFSALVRTVYVAGAGNAALDALCAAARASRIVAASEGPMFVVTDADAIRRVFPKADTRYPLYELVSASDREVLRRHL